MPSVVKASAEGPPWALREVDRLIRNPKGWPTQEAGVGRTPEGEGGPNGPTGFLTLPGEEGSSPEIRPRNRNMIECERRPNGTRNEHERSGGQQQEQKNLEKSCRGLIFGERLTEEKLD